MTAPIDIECPACSSPAGDYCTSPVSNSDPKVHQRLTFHHAERIDAAVRQDCRASHNPTRLREALRETLAMLHAYVEGCNATDDRRRLAALRREFDLSETDGRLHAPMIDPDPSRIRIIGCTCGWRVPRDTINSDAEDALAEHCATISAAGRGP